MTPTEKKRLTLKAEIFKAMGDPTRLRIIELLQAKEMRVSELAGILEADVPCVSKHLSLLRACGLVSSRKEGPQIYYTLIMPQFESLMRCVEERRMRQTEQMSAASLAKIRDRDSSEHENRF
jgi:DNA-binding transcriptional ArsR family regulator